MRIAIIGAGNIGSLYGGNLARIGVPVVLVDPWQEHVTSIQRDGLRLTGLHGDFTLPLQAVVAAEEAGPADVAMICVNTTHTRDAAESAHKILTDDGFVLTLQNGLGNIEILTEVLGTGRVMAGLTFHSADLQSPGCVRHTNSGPTYFGELDRQETDRVRQLQTLFEQAEMNPVVSADILATIWSKFVHNCGINALCALTDLRPNELAAVTEMDDFQSAVIREALAVVRANGIQLPDADPTSVIKEYCAGKGHRVSMAQHLARRVPTEIDSLNGFVVRESHKHGLAAPFNAALVAAIKGRERALGARG